MIEVAAAMTAEQVAEYSAYGELLGSRGERGVYRCEGEGEQWVALDLASDPLSADERAAWCAERPPDQAAKELLDAGIPAATMVPAFMTLDDPQLRARGFFERVEHPLVGEQEYPGWPMRFSRRSRPVLARPGAHARASTPTSCWARSWAWTRPSSHGCASSASSATRRSWADSSLTAPPCRLRRS